MSLRGLAGGGRQEVLGQRQDVLGAVAQRRQVDVDDVQPVEQVLAEAAVRQALFQILVGGGDDAHVDLLAARRPQRPDLALLQDAQQLGLQRGRQLADLVEEQGAAVGLDEQAGAIRARVGERAALVAEQLALQQRVGDGGAVDGDERAFAARAVEVERLRHQLLAGARLAGDQHRRRRTRQPPDEREHLLHDGRPADDVVEAVVALRPRRAAAPPPSAARVRRAPSPRTGSADRCRTAW